MPRIVLTKASHGFLLTCQCGCGQDVLIQSTDDYIPVARDFGFVKHASRVNTELDQAYTFLWDHLDDSIDDPGYIHG